MQQGIGIIKRKNPHGVRVIPGFGLTFGVSVTMLACLVLIPLASIIWSAGRLSFSEFIQVVTPKNLAGWRFSEFRRTGNSGYSHAGTFSRTLLLLRARKKLLVFRGFDIQRKP